MAHNVHNRKVQRISTDKTQLQRWKKNILKLNNIRRIKSNIFLVILDRTLKKININKFTLCICLLTTLSLTLANTLSDDRKVNRQRYNNANLFNMYIKRNSHDINKTRIQYNTQFNRIKHIPLQRRDPYVSFVNNLDKTPSTPYYKYNTDSHRFHDRNDKYTPDMSPEESIEYTDTDDDEYDASIEDNFNNATDIDEEERRRRRYVRFPFNSKNHNGRPFYQSTSSVTGNFHSWSALGSLRPPQHTAPSMRPRSPRLVFRDPVEPGTLSAPGGFFGNGLQDVGFEDERGCGVSIGKLGAQRRIVGGDEAGFGSFPWQAYIRIGSSRCGGSLVNRYHVVTAGHCVARASARQVQVTLGDYVINSAVEPLPAYTFGVREIRVHPYFKFTPQADRFDVAVLRLDRPVQYMPHIAPICLPEKNEDFLGQFGWAAGWGALQAGSRLRPKTLQAVDVPVIDNRLCERWHKSNGINVIIYDEMMCAGYRNGGKDSCQGDSGGPLMMEKSSRWYLIGIVSAGYSCAQRGQPGIYHRVAYTVDWISYVINS